MLHAICLDNFNDQIFDFTFIIHMVKIIARPNMNGGLFHVLHESVLTERSVAVNKQPKN